MQEALLSPGNAGRLRSALELKPFASGDQRLASPRGYLNLPTLGVGGGGDDALFRCSSLFSPSFGFSSMSPLATSSVSVSLSPSSASLVHDCDAADADAATGHRIQLARLALQYQEVAERYELYLARLADAAEEAAALHRENAEIRAANGDITHCLALLSGIGKQAAAAAIADEVRRLRFGDHKESAPEKPAAMLPKSISGCQMHDPSCGAKCPSQSGTAPTSQRSVPRKAASTAANAPVKALPLGSAVRDATGAGPSGCGTGAAARTHGRWRSRRCWHAQRRLREGSASRGCGGGGGAGGGEMSSRRRR